MAVLEGEGLNNEASYFFQNYIAKAILSTRIFVFQIANDDVQNFDGISFRKEKCCFSIHVW